MAEIRVGIVGIGNCCSSLVQGVHMYSKEDSGNADSIGSVGMMHKEIGDYSISDIKFVAGFDIDVNKVGLDISEAIYASPNNTIRLMKWPVPTLGASVYRGMTHDGIGRYTKSVVIKSKGPTDNVVRILKDNGVDVLVNYLPVGSEEAAKWYAEQAIQAGCAFVNCMPVFLASDKTGYWPSRFQEAKLPIIGDDVKSQIGATIIHRVLCRLFQDRGCSIDNSYQLNFGGNTDFLNMLDRDRLTSKKISKTGSVQSQMDEKMPDDNLHVGPSDYVPWLKDRKWAFIRIEGRNFGGAPVSVELKLEVHDSPNSAGVVIDAIRCAMLAKDRKEYGPITPPSSCFMKTPPIQYPDFEASELLDLWIHGK